MALRVKMDVRSIAQTQLLIANKLVKALRDATAMTYVSARQTERLTLWADVMEDHWRSVDGLLQSICFTVWVT